MEVITIIISVVQGVAALITLLILLSKTFREWVFGKKRIKEEADNEKKDQIDATKSLLRNEITHIYYKNVLREEIRAYEYENVAYLYSSYKGLGGNSYVDKIWEEMQDWKIIP